MSYPFQMHEEAYFCAVVNSLLYMTSVYCDVSTSLNYSCKFRL